MEADGLYRRGRHDRGNGRKSKQRTHVAAPSARVHWTSDPTRLFRRGCNR
jgi:hypothetical protein